MKSRMGFGSDGFTLIDLIIAIVVLGIGATALLTLIINVTRHSVDPLVRQQASAIAQSYMEEVLSQPFCDPDNATCTSGCASATACTTCNSVEASRDLYDAVCDYNFSNINGAEDFNGNIITGLENYNVTVSIDDSSVTLGPVTDELDSALGQVIQIDINVTHDSITDLDVTLKAFKTNF